MDRRAWRKDNPIGSAGPSQRRAMVIGCRGTEEGVNGRFGADFAGTAFKILITGKMEA